MAADHLSEPMPSAADPKTPLLLAIDHVGVAVPDLDVAVSFHTALLGWRLTHREQNADQGVDEAMLAAPGGAIETAQLQLLAPLTPDSPIARFLRRSGPGLQHIAYRVSDIEHVTQTLRDRGLHLIYDRPRTGTRGSLINFLHPRDTGGVLIEVVQAGPVGHVETPPGEDVVVDDPRGRPPQGDR